MKKLLALAALSLFPGVAAAEQPAPLNDAQLDRIVAGDAPTFSLPVGSSSQGLTSFNMIVSQSQGTTSVNFAPSSRRGRRLSTSRPSSPWE